jgi:hypothetical protein
MIIELTLKAGRIIGRTRMSADRLNYSALAGGMASMWPRSSSARPLAAMQPGNANAFAAGWSTNGVLVDVSNNVGKTNPVFAPFEVAPFSIGQISNVVPGQLVPGGTKVTFDLNLEDPFVLAYVQTALDDGRLRLMVSSLHTSAGPVGAPSYPDFATHFNEASVEPTRLELEGVVVSDRDIDKDGLPDDWEQFELGTLTWDGAADADGDGASNAVEYQAGTHPSPRDECAQNPAWPGRDRQRTEPSFGSRTRQTNITPSNTPKRSTAGFRSRARLDLN